MEFQDSVMNIIQQVMPAGTKIEIVSSNFDFHLKLFWSLTDEKNRPHKDSKTISVFVTHAVVDDFKNASNKTQVNMLRVITQFLSQNLSSLDPKNNYPKGQRPAEVTWFIDANLFIPSLP